MIRMGTLTLFNAAFLLLWVKKATSLLWEPAGYVTKNRRLFPASSDCALIASGAGRVEAGESGKHPSPGVNLMRLKHEKTLITGKPGVGKTTLLTKIVERMGSVHMAGFYTTEIRSQGSRVGFELCGVNGKRRILAHVDIHSQDRVGKYKVDRRGFEEFLEILGLLNPGVGLIVIDEIGKMELFSKRFRSLVSDVLNSDKQLLATIALEGEGFIRDIKERSDVRLLELTRDNREHLLETIVEGW
jgi:nucleoside-triphosphatase